MKKEFSLEHKKYKRRLLIRRAVVWSLRIGILVLFVHLWEALSNSGAIDPFFFSSPSRIKKVIVDLYESEALFNHMTATLYETVLGFLISTLAGTVIAILLWWSPLVSDVAEPYLVTLNALPKIALGPMIIIWVGAGREAIITMAILICIVMTVISMLTGFTSVGKEKTMLLKSMRANRLQILIKLVLPSNIPTFISVLKINVGLSWVGTIMGEYLVSREGIGYLIVYGSQVFQLDLVMASTVILCVLAAVMYVGVSLLEKVIKKRF